MVKKQEDYHTGLPNWMWDSDRLTVKDRMFCVVLARYYSKRNDYVWPSEPTIISKAKIGYDSYYRIRKKLTGLGLISWRPGGGRKHSIRYKLDWLKGSREEIESLKRKLKGSKTN